METRSDLEKITDKLRYGFSKGDLVSARSLTVIVDQQPKNYIWLYVVYMDPFIISTINGSYLWFDLDPNRFTMVPDSEFNHINHISEIHEPSWAAILSSAAQDNLDWKALIHNKVWDLQGALINEYIQQNSTLTS